MAERILMKGNEAIAEAAIRAGCRHYFAPRTPPAKILIKGDFILIFIFTKKTPEIPRTGIFGRKNLHGSRHAYRIHPSLELRMIQ